MKRKKRKREEEEEEGIVLECDKENNATVVSGPVSHVTDQCML